MVYPFEFLIVPTKFFGKLNNLVDWNKKIILMKKNFVESTKICFNQHNISILPRKKKVLIYPFGFLIVPTKFFGKFNNLVDWTNKIIWIKQNFVESTNIFFNQLNISILPRKKKVLVYPFGFLIVPTNFFCKLNNLVDWTNKIIWIKQNFVESTKTCFNQLNISVLSRKKKFWYIHSDSWLFQPNFLVNWTIW